MMDGSTMPKEEIRRGLSILIALRRIWVFECQGAVSIELSLKVRKKEMAAML